MVPMTPTGTEIRKTSRQLTGASRPPSTSPMNTPARAATRFSPSARPRSSDGNASVRIAAELAMIIAPPTACRSRIPISHHAAAGPFSQVTDSSTENAVKIANPRLNILTRPNMSPSRPKLTTSTAVTTEYPVSSHSSRLALPGASGLTPMPRKMSGSAISTMDWLIVIISTPMVVFDRAIHLYRGPTCGWGEEATTFPPGEGPDPARLRG